MVKAYFILFISTLFISCSTSKIALDKENKNTYVFIHGAYHSAWCWNRVVTELKNKGHNAIAIDLPSHGADNTPPEEVTLEDYDARIIKTIQNIDGKVILAGNSLGGISISSAAEKIPDKIKALVYITAILPIDGESVLSVKDPNPYGVPFFKISDDQKTVQALPDKAMEVFYHDCDADLAQEAISNLSIQALSPAIEKVSLTEERYGRIPKFYVECTKDRVLSIDLQRIFHQRVKCEKVFTMETGHIPMLAQPEQLAEYLIDIR